MAAARPQGVNSSDACGFAAALELVVAACSLGILLGWPKRRREQTVTVEPLQPLAVEHVAFGAPGSMPRLPRIHQKHLEAARLE
jgi:hypothetical protein